MNVPVLLKLCSPSGGCASSPVPLLLLVLQVALVEDKVLEEALLLVQLGVAPELPQVPLRNTQYCRINTGLQYLIPQVPLRNTQYCSIRTTVFNTSVISEGHSNAVLRPNPTQYCSIQSHKYLCLNPVRQYSVLLQYLVPSPHSTAVLHTHSPCLVAPQLPPHPSVPSATPRSPPRPYPGAHMNMNA